MKKTDKNLKKKKEQSQRSPPQKKERYRIINKLLLKIDKLSNSMCSRDQHDIQHFI